jgi:hypothetical protein
MTPFPGVLEFASGSELNHEQAHSADAKERSGRWATYRAKGDHLTFLVMGLIFCTIAAILSAVAVGIGFLLALCVPPLQLGHAIVAGSVVAAATMHFFIRLMNTATSPSIHDEDIDEGDIILIDPKRFLHRVPRSSKSKGKKK